MTISTTDTLTARQVEIINLVCEGDSDKQIAANLGISVSTVRKHTEAVFRKLNVQNRVQAVRAAVRSGWVTL